MGGRELWRLTKHRASVLAAHGSLTAREVERMERDILQSLSQSVWGGSRELLRDRPFTFRSFTLKLTPNNPCPPLSHTPIDGQTGRAVRAKIIDTLMPNRSIDLGFTIDASRIDGRQLDAEIKQLEKWCEDGVIEIIISEPAGGKPLKEASPRRFVKARHCSPLQPLATTPSERNEVKEISHALLGRDPKSADEACDVGMLFTAMKHTGSLITEHADSHAQTNGILGRRAQLRHLGIIVCRTHNAVAKVRERIRLRDEHAVECSEKQGRPIPDWVGKD